MRATIALVRAAWLTAASYRLNLVLSCLGAAATVVPVYYVATALQGTMAHAIRGEAAGYFGFVVLGLVCYNLAVAAANGLPTAVASGIGAGTLETLLSTPAPTPAVLAGLSGYGLLWAGVRAGVLLLGGMLFGVRLWWSGAPVALVVFALVVLAYLAVGMLESAMLVAFRVRTPLVAGVTTVSALLGGVYYPTGVVPAWLARLTPFVPLTHGARAVRRLLLEGRGWMGVRGEVAMLALESAALVALGAAALALALRHARRAGTLGQY